MNPSMGTNTDVKVVTDDDADVDHHYYFCPLCGIQFNTSNFRKLTGTCGHSTCLSCAMESLNSCSQCDLLLLNQEQTQSTSTGSGSGTTTSTSRDPAVDTEGWTTTIKTEENKYSGSPMKTSTASDDTSCDAEPEPTMTIKTEGSKFIKVNLTETPTQFLIALPSELDVDVKVDTMDETNAKVKVEEGNAFSNNCFIEFTEPKLFPPPPEETVINNNDNDFQNFYDELTADIRGIAASLPEPLPVPVTESQLIPMASSVGDIKPTTKYFMKYHKSQRKRKRKKIKAKALHICHVCDERFVQKTELTNHLKNHKGERPFPCYFCKRRFSKPYSLTKHIKNTHNNNHNQSIEVEDKDKELAQRQATTEHRVLYLKRSDRGPGIDTVVSTSNGNSSIIPFKTTERKSQMKYRKKQAEKGGPVTVDEAEEPVKVNKPKSPDKTKHRKCKGPGNENTLGKSESPVISPKVKNADLKVPPKSRRKGKRILEPDLKKMREEEGKNLFECNICRKTFDELCDLRLHRRIHFGEQPFKCNLCDKRFRRRFHLQQHSKIHEKEKRIEVNVEVPPNEVDDKKHDHEDEKMSSSSRDVGQATKNLPSRDNASKSVTLNIVIPKVNIAAPRGSQTTAKNL